MKVALVHDFLKEYGGAERVLEALHEVWPEAPIYTAFVDWQGLGPHAERITKWNIRQSALGKTWLIKRLHSPLRFLAPFIWESFNLDEFDVVISSSGWYICRGILTQPETLHICYLHHPPRHLYGYKTALEWQKYLPIRIYGYLVNHFLRIYDYLASQRVDYFIANSYETQKRIAKFYRHDSVVIYPPVNTSEMSRVKHLRGVRNTSAVARRQRRDFSDGDGETEQSNDYFLCVSRLARAKNIHLAIGACNKLKLPLKIVGKGREEDYLKSVAGSTVKFLGEITDEKLSKIYPGAKALIFPAEDEEFGIVPVEAMAHGVPVIAFRSGGVVETVINGKTGLLFNELTTESLIKAIEQFNHLTIQPSVCIDQAKKFSKERFKREIKKVVNQQLKHHYTES